MHTLTPSGPVSHPNYCHCLNKLSLRNFTPFFHSFTQQIIHPLLQNQVIYLLNCLPLIQSTMCLLTYLLTHVWVIYLIYYYYFNRVTSFTVYQ